LNISRDAAGMERPPWSMLLEYVKNTSRTHLPYLRRIPRRPHARQRRSERAASKVQATRLVTCQVQLAAAGPGEVLLRLLERWIRDQMKLVIPAASQ
jgi:hypothetical protein